MELQQEQYRGWHAKKDRFEQERSRFNFDRLAFEDDAGLPSSAGPSSSAEAADSTRTMSIISTGAGASSHNKGLGMDGTETSCTANVSSEFSGHLNIEPSQRFARQAMMKGRKSSHRSDSNGYLKELELNKLATEEAGFWGREAELEQLKTAYHVTNKKMATIIGYSGSGKSVLAQQITQRIRNDQNNVIVCFGKFDVQNQADPYAAITESINSLVRQIAANQTILEEFREKLQTTLGEETKILEEIVPSVKLLLRKKKEEELNGKEQVDAQKTTTETTAKTTKDPKHEVAAERRITERATRIRNVLVEFLRLVSSEAHPIVILLDDIQWAGPASFGLLETLLYDLHLKHFFLFATCRQEYLPDEDIEHAQSNEDVANTISKSHQQQLEKFLRSHSDCNCRVYIGGLGVDPVRQLIDNLLRMDASEETKRLAEIVHQKTGGNPFFVLQFMNLLVEENLLVYELGAFAWLWDITQIQSHNVAYNVAQVVRKRLNTLPRVDLLILQVASCIGSSFEVALLEFLVGGLHDLYKEEWTDVDWPSTTLTNHLDKLVHSGVLETSHFGGKYDFSHDQIQSAAYSSTPPEREVPMKITIGRRLIEGLDSFQRDRFLFTAVQLCGVKLDEMKEEEKKHYAFWSFVAGDTAMRQGAFHAALDYFDKSASCLGENPFKSDPELSLPLFSGAAEAAYCVGTDIVDEYIEKVLSEPGIPFVKKVRVVLVQLKVLSGRRDFQGCATAFRSAIKEFGVANFAENPSIFSALYQLKKTSNMLKKLSYDQKKILALPECTDYAVRGALSAAATSVVHLFLANPNLYILATCKSVQLSLKYGHSKATPSALASFGVCINIFGDHENALKVGETALALCEAYEYKSALPQTVGLVFGFVRPWSRPMHQFVAPMQYAIDIGMRLGCIDDVAFLMNTYGLMAWLCSINTLPENIKEVEGFRHAMKMMNHEEQVSFTECGLQFAHKLAYPQSNNCSMTGKFMSEEAMLELAEKNNDLVLTANVYYFRTMLHVYFGRPVEASACGENVVSFGFSYGMGGHCIPRCTFFIGLANSLAYKVNGRSKHLRAAKTMKKRVVTWMKKGNPNVLHFSHILDGELFSLSEKWLKAKAAYEAAIKNTNKTGLKIDFALSNELLSLFYANPKNSMYDKAQASFYMDQAIRSYDEYGAANKVSHLRKVYPELTAKGISVSVGG